MSGVEQLRVENEVLKQENSQLRCQLEYLKKKLFGTGKSEKLDPAQRELMLGQIEAIEKQIEAIRVPAHERKKSEPKISRDERYDHLPIEDQVEVIPPEVQANPDQWERTEGSEETFEIDYHAPRFFRRRIVRPKFRNVSDRNKPLVVAPAPVRVISGLVSANLLALIMVQKFVDHLPLYRQSKIFKRQGCMLAVESMVRWVEKASEWVMPVYNQMKWELLQGNYLQVDETPITFCDPDQGIKKSKKGYLCVLGRPDGHTVFVWSKSRSHADVTRHLKGFEGVLQSDAYGAYIGFSQEHEAIKLAGCMAHCRRKFVEAQPYNPRECELVLRLMGRLYRVEKQIRENEPALKPKEVIAKRTRESQNTLNRLKRIFGMIQRGHRPQEPVRKAADYALGNWKYLSEYLYHGQVQIDNNGIENAIRPTAVGKKNWLFIGHPNAGDRAAVLYSILISCERAGINAQDYLREIFSTDLSKLSSEQLSKLTPLAKVRSQLQNRDVA